MQNDRVKNRLPIWKSVLHLILQNLDKVFQDPQPYLTTLYKALFTAVYYGLFRVGELTAGSYGVHTVKAKDVHTGKNKQKLMFVLHTSKTHDRGSKPQITKINCVEFDSLGWKNYRSQRCNNLVELCPFTLLRNYLHCRKYGCRNNNENFFMFSDRSMVTQQNFNKILRLTLKVAGLNPVTVVQDSDPEERLTYWNSV